MRRLILSLAKPILKKKAIEIVSDNELKKKIITEVLAKTTEINYISEKTKERFLEQILDAKRELLLDLIDKI